MSLLVHLKPIWTQIKELGTVVPGHFRNASTTEKIVVTAAAASVAVLGILARYMRRKRLVADPNKYGRWAERRHRLFSGMRSPNGDVGSLASGGGRSSYAGGRTTRTGPPSSILTASERASLASDNAPSADGTARLTPQQLGVMGMEALETSIAYWEEAMSSYRAAVGAVLTAEETAFCRDLDALLEAAVDLQGRSEMLFLDQRSVLFGGPGGGAGSGAGGGGGGGVGGGGCMSPESFASAVDRVADLSEFEEEAEGGALYAAALARLEEGGGGVPCRTLRTDLVQCGSDAEYLAKLHCVRLACQRLLSDVTVRRWLADAGRQALADLLLYADRDPKEFLVAYEAMLAFVTDTTNRPALEQELAARGVRALTFYDVVVDYILLDAFEDLERPPSSVVAVVQNRWLSDGFKETALVTAVWSVLKAKRRMLQQPNGFMAHFYAISEQLLPTLAWGFLGPDDSLRDTCIHFREQVMGLVVDMFSFEQCRYTTVDELSTDLGSVLQTRLANVAQRFACAPL